MALVTTTLTLTHLPDELLVMLPDFLYTLEEFIHLSSTCRRLRNVLLSLTSRKTILQLAHRLASSGLAPSVLRPHPDMLALATARQLAEWVLAEDLTLADNPELDSSLVPSRLGLLTTAFQSGIRGILSLALDPRTTSVGLSLSSLRNLHALSLRSINPLTQTIDAMVGTAWYSIPDFWDTVSDAFTLNGESGSATRQLLLYGELFGPSLDVFLQSRGKKKPGMLDARVRIEFIKYCVPSPWCTPTERPGEVLRTGPFAQVEVEGTGFRREDNQTALDHLVGGPPFEWKREKLGGLWGKAWTRVIIAAGATRKDWPMPWRQKLKAVQFRKKTKPIDPREVEDSELNQSERTDGGEMEHGEEDGAATDQAQAQGTEEANGDNDDNVKGDEGSDHDHDYPIPSPRHIVNENNMRDEDWRFRLFWTAVTQVGGLRGMEMVAQFKGREEGQDVVMKPEWKERIRHYMNLVMAIDDDDRPEDMVMGGHGLSQILISQAPHLRLELYYCCSNLWGGL